MQVHAIHCRDLRAKKVQLWLWGVSSLRALRAPYMLSSMRADVSASGGRRAVAAGAAGLLRGRAVASLTDCGVASHFAPAARSGRLRPLTVMLSGRPKRAAVCRTLHL